MRIAGSEHDPSSSSCQGQAELETVLKYAEDFRNHDTAIGMPEPSEPRRFDTNRWLDSVYA